MSSASPPPVGRSWSGLRIALSRKALSGSAANLYGVATAELSGEIARDRRASRCSRTAASSTSQASSLRRRSAATSSKWLAAAWARLYNGRLELAKRRLRKGETERIAGDRINQSVCPGHRHFSSPNAAQTRHCLRGRITLKDGHGIVERDARDFGMDELERMLLVRTDIALLRQRDIIEIQTVDIGFQTFNPASGKAKSPAVAGPIAAVQILDEVKTVSP